MLKRRESLISMESFRLLISLTIIFSSLSLVYAESSGRITFEENGRSGESSIPEREESDDPTIDVQGRQAYNNSRQGKDLFDWIGLGTGQHVDPYLAKTNQNCLKGDLAECFKSRALNYFVDFFDYPEYQVNENVKVIRLPRNVVNQVNRQPYEYSSTPRSDESEWDQLMKFALRKAERFVKSVAIQIAVPSSETGDNEVYAPRFLDEIADEIDTLEDKKDTLFSRHQLRKLLIPMLIVLKLFKLKLLLFLPLILGLVSFKKFLGFLAILIPGAIAFFKLSRPGGFQTYQPIYSQAGVVYPHYKENIDTPDVNQGGYLDDDYHGGYHTGDSVSFGQDLAYKGYREYRT